MLARFHFLESSKALLCRAIPEGGCGSGGDDITAVLFHLIGRLLIDISEAISDEMLGAIIEKVEVITGEVKIITPIKTKPANIVGCIALAYPGRC